MPVKFWFFISYRKVASSRLSSVVTRQRIFRLFKEGKFDTNILWPLAQRVHFFAETMMSQKIV